VSARELIVRAAAALVAMAPAACTSARADEPGYELRVAPETTLELGASGAVAHCRVERSSGIARSLLLGIVRRIERVVLRGLDEGVVVRIEIELAP